MVAGDNDGGPNNTSQVAFAVTAGVTYYMAVDGTGGVSGNIQLTLVLTVPPPPGPGTIASWNFETSPYADPLLASTGTGLSASPAGLVPALISAATAA